MDELMAMADIARAATERAIDENDMDTMFEWGRAFHLLANQIRDEFGVEIRTPV